MDLTVPVNPIGRASELDLLESCCTGALAGHGTAVVLEGPAGIGKTTLLAAAAERARDRGFMVLHGCADELETDAAWGVVLELFGRAVDADDAALFTGAADLARPLLTHAPTPGSAADPFPIMHGLHWLTATLAERHPLVMIVDDAQWSDPLSLRFVHYLTRRLDGLRVAVLLARRTGEPIDATAAEILGRLAVTPGVVTRPVGPLTDEVVDVMLRSDLPEAEPTLRAGVVAAVAGNPYLYREVVGALRSKPADTPADVAGTLQRLQLLHVRDTIRVRLGRLGRDAARIAEATAVLGSAANIHRVAQLAGVDDEQAVGAIERLAAADILASTSPLRFVHPIVRQVVYADLGDARRRADHRSAAEILHADGAVHTEVAGHLVRAEPFPLPWAADALRRAAASAYASGAFARAVTLMEHALAGERRSSERARMLLELGRYEVAAGRPTAVVRLRDALQLVPQTPEHADVAWQLGDSLYGAGRFADAVHAYERGLQLVAASAATDRDPVVEARLIAGLHTASLLLGAPVDLAVSRVGALVAEPPATPSLADRIVLASAVGACALGNELSRAQVLSLADRVLDTTTPGDALTRPLLEPVPSALIMCDEYDRAIGLLDGFITAAQRAGEIVAYASLLPIRAYALLCRGRLADAITDATDMLRLTEDAPPASRQALAPARLVLALAALARGEPAEADRAVDVPDATELWGETPLMGWYLHALGHVRLARGDNRSARDAFLGAGRAFGTGGGTGTFCPWRSGAALALHALGDPGAHELVDTELRLARAFGSPRAIAVSLRCRARLAGSAEHAVDLLTEASEVLRGSEADLERAGVEVERGAALRRLGHRRDARTPLREGMELARRIGAWAVVATAASELEATGARRPSLRTSGVDSLTPAERRVARMAAAGQTNREIAQALFVTRKTVEVHLTSAYRKLGITSRGELPSRL